MAKETSSLSKGEIHLWLKEIDLELSDIPKKIEYLQGRQVSLQAEKASVEKLLAEGD